MKRNVFNHQQKIRFLEYGVVRISDGPSHKYSTLSLFEVQYLPQLSTSLFHLIHQLCQIMFSPSNQTMTWRNVLNELYDLLNSSIYLIFLQLLTRSIE